jgi:hypothetical protein
MCGIQFGVGALLSAKTNSVNILLASSYQPVNFDKPLDNYTMFNSFI